MFKCVGFFVNSVFKKSETDWLLADVYGFGTLIRNSKAESSEFVPSHALQIETQISKAMPLKISDSCYRQEILLRRIATITQLTEDKTHLIITFINKAIGYFSRQEKRSVILDFGLNTNEVIMLDGENFIFSDKTKLRDYLSMPNAPIPSS